MLKMSLVAAALSLALPAAALSHSGLPDPCEADADLVVDAACLDEPAIAERRPVLFEAAQRAWLQYRAANCALFGHRTSESAMLEAQAQCWAFMTRERDRELELLRHVLEGEADDREGEYILDKHER